jgi:hypothetical protein
MKKSYKTIVLTIGVVMLFFLSSMDSGAAGFVQKVRQDLSTKKNLSTNSEVIVSCTAGGIPIKKRISLESCQHLQQLFSALVQANADNPCGKGTRMLKLQFIELLADLGLLSQGLSAEDVCSLIEPTWLHSAESLQRSHLISPRASDDENNATLLFCSMAGAGWGFVVPPFLLPRPRLLMLWRGFYPDRSAVSIAEMATGRGVIARGTQLGTAFGFIGVGFAFAFPGAPAQFGFLGYSLLSKVQAADMSWYYSNFPPLVMDPSPENGAVNVPVSLSELMFTLKDFDNDPMSYSVVTSPDIGSGADANVENGQYSIPISGLESGIKYTWTVTVSDGTDIVENAFTFTTETVAPFITNPIPANNAQYVPLETSNLSFDLIDYQGDLMDWTIETQPDIGSGAATGVGDGRYSINISGLDYFTSYKWFVNVTDGAHPMKKTFVFRTIAENTLVLEPTDDAIVLENYPDDNSGVGDSIVLRSLSGWEWDGLIKFDLSAIPSNATIQYASLQAYYYKNWDGNPSGHHVNLYRILSNWNEETVTWVTHPLYDTELSSFAVMPSAIENWVLWNVTDDVVLFYHSGTPNYGWRMKDVSGDNTCSYFRSKEYSAFHPILIIDYET